MLLKEKHDLIRLSALFTDYHNPVLYQYLFRQIFWSVCLSCLSKLIALGSIGLSVPVRTYSFVFSLNLSKKLIMQSGIGICLQEDSLLGSVMMSLVFLSPSAHWMRCIVLVTVKIRFSRSTFRQSTPFYWIDSLTKKPRKVSAAEEQTALRVLYKPQKGMQRRLLSMKIYRLISQPPHSTTAKPVLSKVLSCCGSISTALSSGTYAMKMRQRLFGAGVMLSFAESV